MIDERPTPRPRRWARWVALAIAAVAVVLAIKLRNPAAAANPEKPPPAKAAGGPLVVDVVTVAAEPHALEVVATGQLAPAEAVDIVSELSRRLVRIHAEEGAAVKEGEVLYEVDGSDLAARHARLKVQRDLARRVLERREKNSGSGAVSPHEIDVARTELAALEAEMREIAVQLGKTRIRAAFSGVLGTRRVSEGTWLTPDVVITTLYDTSRFKIDFTLPERYADQLTIGGRFAFEVSGHAGEGEITVIEPSVDPASRSVRVRGMVDAVEGLVAGSFATVKLALAPRETFFVPTIAVEASPQGHALWVEKDGHAVRRSVEIGQRTPERLEITHGLAAGDRVIVTNILRLKPDAPVAVREPS